MFFRVLSSTIFSKIHVDIHNFAYKANKNSIEMVVTLDETKEYEIMI